jgi:membrane associated rhomboid family serine protease
MLKFTCCPNFSVYSFIFYITMIDIIVYIVTVIISLTKGGLSSSDFLGPNTDVLDSFGAMIPPKVHSGQVYRLILPIFLHAGFLHIFVSVIVPELCL